MSDVFSAAVRLVVALADARMRLFDRDGVHVGDVPLAPGVVDVRRFVALSTDFEVQLDNCVVIYHGSRVSEIVGLGYGETAASQEYIPSPGDQAERLARDVTRRVLGSLRERELRRAEAADRSARQAARDQDAASSPSPAPDPAAVAPVQPVEAAPAPAPALEGDPGA